jgi:hypothetical protein
MPSSNFWCSYGINLRASPLTLSTLKRLAIDGTEYEETADGNARVVKFARDVKTVFMREQVAVDWPERKVSEIGQNAIEILPIAKVVPRSIPKRSVSNPSMSATNSKLLATRTFSRQGRK